MVRPYDCAWASAERTEQPDDGAAALRSPKLYAFVKIILDYLPNAHIFFFFFLTANVHCMNVGVHTTCV
jgi:hypothetical protein